jgi:hypothetical protein
LSGCDRNVKGAIDSYVRAAGLSKRVEAGQHRRVLVITKLKTRCPAVVK